jgi:hypothetical protein
MKKGLVYTFAAFGVVALLFILGSSLFRVSGKTMFGSNYSYTPVGAMQYEAEATESRAKVAQTPAAMLPSSDVTTNNPSNKRMIIRNANLTLEVNNLGQAVEAISQLANNSGGYVVSSSVVKNDQVRINSYAQISIRVPAEGLHNVITQLKSLSIEVKNESISGEDITQRFVDLQSTLNNLQVAKNQLQKIMDNAKNTEDVLNVFKQLTDTQGQIDVLEGQIKYYKESVALSLISIELQLKPIGRMEHIRSWSLWSTAKNAYRELLDQLEHLTYGIINFIIFFVPLIFIWGVIFLLVFYIGKKIYKVMRKIS